VKLESKCQWSIIRVTIHLIIFSYQITKLRVNTWKTPGMKASKSYKHVALIQLSDIRSLFDINPSIPTLEGKTFIFGIFYLNKFFLLLKKRNNLEYFIQLMDKLIN